MEPGRVRYQAWPNLPGLVQMYAGKMYDIHLACRCCPPRRTFCLGGHGGYGLEVLLEPTRRASQGRTTSSSAQAQLSLCRMQRCLEIVLASRALDLCAGELTLPVADA